MITKEDFKKNSKKRGRPAYKLEAAVNNETKRFENIKEFAAFLEVGQRRAYQIAAQDPRIKKIQ